MGFNPSPSSASVLSEELAPLFSFSTGLAFSNPDLALELGIVDCDFLKSLEDIKGTFISDPPNFCGVDSGGRGGGGGGGGIGILDVCTGGLLIACRRVISGGGGGEENFGLFGEYANVG